jgi:hypothetical protein
MTGHQSIPGTPALFDQALARARADFLEMPGLRLTAAQARRLWTVDATVCDAVLATLVEARFLTSADNRYFIRASSPTRPSTFAVSVATRGSSL